MHRIWIIPVVTALCIAAVTGVISATGDSGVLVPPPEVTAEGFLRAIETGRFSQALPYLHEELRKRMGEDDVRELLMALEREHGKIEDVRGDSSSVRGDEAEAEVSIRTARGEGRVRLQLLREKHLWKISKLPAVP